MRPCDEGCDAVLAEALRIFADAHATHADAKALYAEAKAIAEESITMNRTAMLEMTLCERPN